VASSRLLQTIRHMATVPNSSPKQGPPSAGSEPVLFISELSTRTYVLNRPGQLNALDESMIDLLASKIEEWNRSDQCKIVVGTGEGRAFCAGGDVKGVVKNAAEDATRPVAVRFFQKEFELDYALANLTKPYVAVLDGVTMGGGVGLAISAPFRIATENTLFAMPETKIGYFPDVGASFFLSRLDGELGTYFALTGTSIKGKAVFQAGLATHFVPSTRIVSLLERLSSMEDPAPSLINATIEEYGGIDNSTPDLPGFAPFQLVGDIRAALDTAFAHNTVEEIIADLEKYARTENDVGAWAKQTLEELDLRSPTSLKVSLEAIRRGKNLTLSETFKMEMGLATAYCHGASPDFQEGVTAVLAKKLKTRPNWKPPTVPEVPRADILSSFFEKESPFQKLVPPMSLPTPTTTPESFSRYALPVESEIEAVVRGQHRTSGHTSLTSADLLEKFEGLTSRKSGLKEKLDEVTARKCERFLGPDNLEYLKWKY